MEECSWHAYWYIFFDLLIQINVVVGNVVNAVCYSQNSMALCQYWNVHYDWLMETVVFAILEMHFQNNAFVDLKREVNWAVRTK